MNDSVFKIWKRFDHIDLNLPSILRMTVLAFCTFLCDNLPAQDLSYVVGAVKVQNAKNMSPVSKCGSQKICANLKKLFSSGYFRKHSVLFQVPNVDMLEYVFDLNSDGKEYTLRGYCGHGFDSVCEMTLLLDGGEVYAFSTPSDIRFINFRRGFYLVSGLEIGRRNQIKLKKFSVSQLFPNEIKQLCK